MAENHDPSFPCPGPPTCTSTGPHTHFTPIKPFQKNDAKKNRLDLLPIAALEEVGKVLTFGAGKYAAHNWRRCPSRVRYLAAALRHLFAWARGEDNDPETGLSHVAHASCCCLFLLGLILDGAAVDDRDRFPEAKP